MHYDTAYRDVVKGLHTLTCGGNLGILMISLKIYFSKIE